MTSALPLSGVRVLDLSRVLAGPYCCSLLAEMGAEVIKVERPGSGDENRGWGHLWHGVGLDFINVNRHKRDITINLHTPEGQEIVRRLVRDCDILVENFRTGTLERLNLGYERLQQINPRLIYCAISGFGEKGPLAGKPGYDGALQAFSGHMHVTGEADGGPVRMGASVIDMTTGIVAYGAIMTALLARARTGQGQRIATSLLKTALALMGTHGAVCLNTGIEPTRAGSGVSHLAPYGAYRTQNGYVIAAALNEASWVKLCEVLGCQHLISDPRFADPQQRLRHRRELDDALTAIFRTQSTESWIALFEPAGLVVAPVNTIGDALAHPQTAANGMVLHCETPDGDLALVGPPMDFQAWQSRSLAPLPKLGADTRDILRQLGYDEAEISQLSDRAVV